VILAYGKRKQKQVNKEKKKRKKKKQRERIQLHKAPEHFSSHLLFNIIAHNLQAK